MRKVIFALGLTMIIPAHAAPMKWSDITVSAIAIHSDDDTFDASGMGISGRASINNFYIFGTIDSYDFDNIPVEARTTAFGVGGYIDVAESTAIYGDVGGWTQYAEYTPTGYSEYDSGNAFEFGVRHQFVQELEGTAVFSRAYIDGDPSDSTGIGLRVYLVENIYLSGMYVNDEAGDSISLTAGVAF